jgi:DNA-binding IclR family transcriptional regulator
MVKSAIRVFDLLEVFETERRALRIAEMVALLDAPQSSVSMLVKTLVARGYMDFEPVSHTYSPSARVAFLCNWVTRAPEHPSELRDALSQIARATGETVILARRAGLFVQYVSVIQSHHALRFTLAPGTRRPLHHAALGIMLMTQLDDAQVGQLLRRYNAETRKRDPVAKIADTVRAVQQAREQGWCESANLATPGTGVICTLLNTPIRGQRLGVGVGAPLDRLQGDRKKILSAIREVSALF